MEARLNSTKSQIQKDIESSNQDERIRFKNTNRKITNVSSELTRNIKENKELINRSSLKLKSEVNDIQLEIRNVSSQLEVIIIFINLENVNKRNNKD